MRAADLKKLLTEDPDALQYLRLVHVGELNGAIEEGILKNLEEGHRAQYTPREMLLLAGIHLQYYYELKERGLVKDFPDYSADFDRVYSLLLKHNQNIEGEEIKVTKKRRRKNG